MHGSALHRYAEHCISLARFLNLCISREAPQWHRIQNAVLLMPYRTPFRLFTESLDPFPLIASWLRTFGGAFTFAYSHSEECDPLCVTCSPATWSYHEERYDYEAQFEMVREPRHFPHIGA